MKNESTKRWYQYRKRSINKGLNYLTSEEFKGFWDTPHICCYCGIKESDIIKKYPNLRIKAMTVDRKDTTQGYTKDNIAWACFPCNCIKSFSLTHNEMKEIGKNI